MMETIQEILNFSVGKLTVGKHYFRTCHFSCLPRSNQSIDGSNRKTAG